MTLDPFIRRAHARYPKAPSMPKDPVGRRVWAAEQSRVGVEILGTPKADVATMDVVIPVAGHPDARARVFWPTPERGGEGLPMYVYFFGGGWTIGGIDEEHWDRTMRRRAAASGAIVVAGEYSLGPERRYPTQPEQCYAIVAWASEHAAELGGSSERLAVGGASAGGNLSAAVTLLNLQRARLPIRLLLLEAPSLDLTSRHVDFHGTGPWWQRLILRWYHHKLVMIYAGRRALLKDPIVSPLRAPSLEGFPRTVIYTGELDPLKGDARAFVTRLAEAGVPAVGLFSVGQTHGSGGMVRWVPAADHLEQDIAMQLRGLMTEDAPYPPA